MNRKSLCVALVVVLLTISFSAEAQQVKKVPQIGFLSGTGSPDAPGPQVEAFRRGLRDLGYFEGKNILVEYRYAAGKVDPIPSLVAELVQLKVDVLVTGSLPAIRAAKQATKTIPIVMVTSQDPVAVGLIDSLARPGGNITGITTLNIDLCGKRLELLKEVVPRISPVGVLWDTGGPGSVNGFKEYETMAHALKIEIQSLGVRGPNPDLEGAFQAAAKGRTNALITSNSIMLQRYPKRIADLAIKNRLPSMNERSEYVEAGGLMYYGTNNTDQYTRAAVFVDKILKGAKPADLPVEQPKKFELVINLKTAKQIGVTIPSHVLLQADKVIK